MRQKQHYFINSYAYQSVLLGRSLQLVTGEKVKQSAEWISGKNIMTDNIFDSKEFQENIIDQVNSLNKLQVEAFNAGYKKGLEDGKNSELDKQMKEQEGVETTESKIQSEFNLKN